MRGHLTLRLFFVDVIEDAGVIKECPKVSFVRLILFHQLLRIKFSLIPWFFLSCKRSWRRFKKNNKRNLVENWICLCQIQMLYCHSQLVPFWEKRAYFLESNLLHAKRLMFFYQKVRRLWNFHVLKYRKVDFYSNSI